LNRNRVKLTGFGSVRFFRARTGSNRFGSVFWFGSVFSVLAWFFLVLARFFSGFDSVRFGFFGFLLIKPNRTGWFFQNFNRFNRVIFGSVFSVIFFPV
jgi:hypothetical protein